MNLITLLKEKAEINSDNSAYTFLNNGQEQSDLSFSRLDLWAQTIAAHLQQLCKTGDRAILLYSTGPDFICAFFGCIYAGIIAVPAYPPDPGRLERSTSVLLSIIRNAKPKKILTTSAYLDMAYLLFSEYPQLNKIEWIATDIIPQDSCLDWKYPDIQKESIAYLQYTSGSTSSPKGVVITHEATLANLQLGEYLNTFSNDSRIVGWVPLYHDLGLIAYVIGTVYHACKCYLMPPHEFIQQPFRWLDAISRYKATHNAAPSFAYDLCARKITEVQKQLLDLSSWTVAGVGAEAVPYQTLSRFSKTFKDVGFKETSFYPSYGMAEAVLYISGGLPLKSPPVIFAEADAFHKGSIIPCPLEDNKKKGYYITACGHTGPGYETIIVDPETDVQLDENHIGEIWHSGPGIGSGYFETIHDNPGYQPFNHYTTDQKGPFIRTGDLGFMHDSALYITGRLKEMIIIRGVKYYPQDIELSHALLRKGCGAAFSILVENQEKLVVVQEITTAEPKEAVLKEIQRDVEITVARFHELTLYDLVLIKPGNIPKTSSGKIQRTACKKLYCSQKFVKMNHKVTRNQSNALSSNAYLQSIQNWLTDQIASHMDVPLESIDIFTPYTHYTVDSLVWINLINDIALQFHLSVNLETLNRYPTLDDLSRYILEKLNE
jgi:acyl-CoA synthetase (AMP-forming)/AMP-acid ligase II/acyl carrier protein